MFGVAWGLIPDCDLNTEVSYLILIYLILVKRKAILTKHGNEKKVKRLPLIATQLACFHLLTNLMLCLVYAMGWIFKSISSSSWKETYYINKTYKISKLAHFPMTEKDEGLKIDEKSHC